MDTCNQNKVVLVVFLLAKTSFTATFTSSYVALALYHWHLEIQSNKDQNTGSKSPNLSILGGEKIPI